MNLELLLTTLILLLMQLLGSGNCRTIPAAVAANAAVRKTKRMDIDNSIDIDIGDNTQFDTIAEGDWAKFVQLPERKIHQRPGVPIELVCEIIGSGVVDIQWKIGHLSKPEIADLVENSIDERGNAITSVRSAHIIDHGLSRPRTYTCVGRAGTKMVHTSTTIYPREPDRHERKFIGPQQPYIVYTEKTHMDTTGRDVLLPCKVHAHGAYKLRWTDNNGLAVGADHSQLKVLPNGDLLIPEINWKHMGNYKCSVENKFGAVMQDTFLYPAKKEN